MRWNLLDRFLVLQRGKCAEAVKSFQGSEDFFQEHFPGHPIVPQPLLLEMIAQAGGVLYGLGFDFKKEVILAKISEAKWDLSVTPPCQLKVKVVLEEAREEAGWVSGAVWQGEKSVAQARVMLVSIERLDPQQNEKIVFTDDFLKHYQVYELAGRVS